MQTRSCHKFLGKYFFWLKTIFRERNFGAGGRQERIVIKDDYLSFGQKNVEGLRTAVEEPGKNLRKYKRINTADAA